VSRTLSYRAEWVLPISTGPIRDACVGVSAGRIVAVGDNPPPDALDLGRVVILPALVNAHTHLELSHLRGQVPPTEHFLDWIRKLLGLRRQPGSEIAGSVIAAARAGIEEARASGTGLVGDVSNTLLTVPLLCESAMPARVFYELLGFELTDPRATAAEARRKADTATCSESVRISLAAHAPYSVSPGLFAAIRADVDGRSSDRSSVHLAESVEEVEFIERGTGAWRTLLQDLGVWTDAWQTPGCSPAAYVDRLGFLDDRVLVAHAVQCSSDDLRRLSSRGVTIVSCPRSNQHVGVGPPPLDAFYGSDAKVALGTDSLASVEDLNMFAELAAARQLARQVPARRFLESATLTGAVALGFGADLGSLEVGKRAAMIAVQLPDALIDVEEYLLSGIEPEMVRWLDDGTGSSGDSRDIVV
jgi:cytosine/adenosine deaminase-related metal-dependent hydrolase